jgi:fructose-bisphosphate aldolase class II
MLVDRNSKSVSWWKSEIDIERIKAIKKRVNIPLVLHGGSGIKDDVLVKAIDAGISIIHINTELRLTWRKVLEELLKDDPSEIVPYKILPKVIAEIEKLVEKKLRVFNRIF